MPYFLFDNATVIVVFNFSYKLCQVGLDDLGLICDRHYACANVV